MTELSDLADQFHDAMVDLCRREATEAHRNPSKFHKMLEKRGLTGSSRPRPGLKIAKTFLHKAEVTYGFQDLIKRGYPDLTVEALMLEPEWTPLFSDHEREIARMRLDKAVEITDG